MCHRMMGMRRGLDAADALDVNLKSVNLEVHPVGSLKPCQFLKEKGNYFAKDSLESAEGE